jgi:hypothetical protein
VNQATEIETDRLTDCEDNLELENSSSSEEQANNELESSGLGAFADFLDNGRSNSSVLTHERRST